MKLEKIKYIILILLGGMLMSVPPVYAKTSVEIKPNSTLVYTNQTISDFFDESLAMKDPGQGLASDNVDVHMAKNTEWAIVSYFSNSAYGTKGEGQNVGVTVSINDQNYLSTNGNATGVMDFGKTATFTAGVTNKYEGIVDTESVAEAYDYGKSIIVNATNSKYVDLLSYNKDFLNSIAATNWYDSKAQMFETNAKTYPYSVRSGLFGFFAAYGAPVLDSGNKVCDGSPGRATFRPIIWN